MQDSLLKKNSSILTFVIIIILTVFFSLVDVSTETPQDQNVGEQTEISNKIYLEQVDGQEVGKYKLSDDEKLEIFEVKRTVDGDTIRVLDSKGEEYTVRIIGVDTPETVDPRKEIQCFGKEASQFTKDTLEGKKVYLISDDTQDLVDKYGRILRYVVREDGFFLNYNLVRFGYAFEYTYNVPYVFQSEFKMAQQYAEDIKLGLWGADCTE